MRAQRGIATASSSDSSSEADTTAYLDGSWILAREPVDEPVEEPGLGDLAAELVEEFLEDAGFDDQPSPVASASPVVGPFPSFVYTLPTMTSPAERQLAEMFARYRIDQQYSAKFRTHNQLTPHDVYRAGINKEKAQNNMCLSPYHHIALYPCSFASTPPPPLVVASRW